MFRSQMYRLVGATAVAAMGLLATALPAAAAPATADGLSVGPREGAALDTRAQMQTEAGVGDLPPNVTVKIIPEVQKVDGPTDVYRQGDAAASTDRADRAAPGVPFNFILDDVSYGINTRQFSTTRTSVCMDIKIVAVQNPGAALYPFYVNLYRVTSGNDQSHGRVAVPRDNRARSYCWSGTNSSGVYYFNLGFGQGGGQSGVYEYVDGSGTVRNP